MNKKHGSHIPKHNKNNKIVLGCSEIQMLIVDDFDVEQIAGKARVAEVKFRAFDQSLGDVLVVGRKEVYHNVSCDIILSHILCNFGIVLQKYINISFQQSICIVFLIAVR